jgi:hypothetical protein
MNLSKASRDCRHHIGHSFVELEQILKTPYKPQTGRRRIQDACHALAPTVRWRSFGNKLPPVWPAWAAGRMGK